MSASLELSLTRRASKDARKGGESKECNGEPHGGDREELRMADYSIVPSNIYCGHETRRKFLGCCQEKSLGIGEDPTVGTAGHGPRVHNAYQFSPYTRSVEASSG